ncbi:MAG: autophagy protein 13 [Claussenomyces sp. TS43310]|nr:MAG: autophagy protein 13 [Claussenomyces sp. TS43310]
MASPASSPRTNPNRTNNPREERLPANSRPPSDIPVYNEAEEGTASSEGVAIALGPSKESHKKLDQIIQSRMSLPIIFTREQNKKVNKWFQLETDDTDAFRDDLRAWKTCGGFENRPPPLIVETYLDTMDLTSDQSLVIMDDTGKRWDVAEALNGSGGSNESDADHRKSRTEIVLERWRIELKDGPDDRIHDFGAILPSVYKKCIVFFRSLYATTKFVPAWRLVRTLAKSGQTNGPLRAKCRILSSEVQSSSYDPLAHRLYDSDSPVVTAFSLGETDSPAGRFHASLSYRNNCNFRVDDSEALLSSRFMGADESYFQPSLGAKESQRRQPARTVEAGSLPAHRQRSDLEDPVQAYGSLSTFHGNAPPLGSSPISALRAARTLGSDASSPSAASPSSLRSRPIQTSRPSAPSLEGVVTARRPSLSFQPFKAGSLSASPGPGTPLTQAGDMPPPQSPQSLTRSSGMNFLTHARNRSSLTAGMPASLRGVPILPENTVSSSTSSSPKPAPISRYSSSFSHRRGKLSYGGGSKVEDDQGSSGKQSLSSSVAQPGSGILAEGGAGGSSGSLQTDDENISDFLKLLDSKKTLQSFESSRIGEASAKRASAQLSRFQSMRESNNVLTESMLSSEILRRPSSSASRQLSSVPPMVAGTSMSTSSSPGKPVSPHTPHTPAIPSRLSANSVAEYSQPRRSARPTRTLPEGPTVDDSEDEDGSEHGTNAIDIPTSPRPYYPHNRRSSSVAQQHRSMAVDEEIGDLPFGVHRSISLGADDREPPSLNSLLGLGQTSDDAAGSETGERALQPAPRIDESSTSLARQLQERDDGPQVPRGLTPGSINAPYRPRIGRMGGRGVTPPQAGSYASLPTDRGSGSGMSDRPGSRYSFSRPSGVYEAEDEPLLFDMSEIGRDHSRRSLEEARGGGGVGQGSSDRVGFDGGRGADSGSSSRRGSRRGW